MPDLRLSQDPDADALLSSDPLALLLGMLLDQQIPMEKAFKGPHVLLTRLGSLDARVIADAEPESFAALVGTPPAVHRFPGSMAKRLQDLCRALVDQYDGRAEAVWEGADDGAELLRRLEALPGFGNQKARIFVALLGKRMGVQPAGWREAAGPYGEDGALRSVADVTGPETLLEVRAYKQSVKAAAKAAAGPATSAGPAKAKAGTASAAKAGKASAHKAAKASAPQAGTATAAKGGKAKTPAGGATSKAGRSAKAAPDKG